MYWQQAGTGRFMGVDWSQVAYLRPVDPYLIWLDMVGLDVIGLIEFKKSYGDKLPVLLELAEPRKGITVEGVEIPSIYREPIGSSGRPAHFVSARVTLSAIGALLADEKSVKRLQLELTKIQDSKPGAPGPQPDHAYSAREFPTDTWLGVIDVGCAFGHAKYRSSATAEMPPVSRVTYLWDQGYRWDRRPALEPARPHWVETHKLGYGAELGPDKIAVAASHLPDEARCYAEVGLDTLAVSGEQHGFGVLDIAAGRPSPLLSGPPPLDVPLDAASALPILFVQLDSLASRETSISSLGVNVLDALRWMLDRVERHGTAPGGARHPERKLVVNLSYGGLAGPHDGSSMLERAMDELIETRGNLAVVLAAGNAYDTSLQTHAKVDLAKGRSMVVQWQMEPDDPTDNFLEVWFPGSDVDDVWFHVTAPGGVRSEALRPDTTWLLHGEGPDAPVLAGGMFRRHAANGEGCAMFLLALQPSAPTRGGPHRAPAGLWKIEVQTDREAPREVHAWIERDDYVAGNINRRQQSSLIDPGDGSVTSTHGLSSIAHGLHTVVAGGYCLSDGGASEDTASGPDRFGRVRLGPDVSAPSDEGRSTPGLLVAGATSGVVNRLSGTSAAAPSVARWLANWYASSSAPVSSVQLRAAIQGAANGPGSPRMGKVVLDAALRPALISAESQGKA